ncbi:MAG: PH domain-containing protein [Rhodoferax sp.]|nr:PH domain-containing protein [Rhodoferax sp.]
MHGNDSPLFDPTVVTATSAQFRSEQVVLWESSEGQVVNFGIFLVCGLLFLLVIPMLYAVYRYAKTARHTYTLTDQRLIEKQGVLIQRIETLELYRVKDISIRSTLLQTIVGRGTIILETMEASSPVIRLVAIPNAFEVSSMLRNYVEKCRVMKGVRAFDR